jgi:mlo protein
MGSSMKQSTFDDQTSKALKNWRAGVKKRAPNSKHGGPGSPSAGGDSPTGTQRKTGDEDGGMGLQAADSAQKAAAGEEYEFVKIDD